MTAPFAARMSGVKPSAIRELLELAADPAIISFGGGYPDPALFPLDQLDAIFHEAISLHGRQSLQYTVSMGLPRLREQIAERMTADGTPTNVENVIVLQGAQQGLDFVAKLLIDPGDLIVTDDPTFLGALIAFNPCQPRYEAVPMDSEGMIAEALEEVLKKQRCKFIYTVPDFQNPTGISMSGARRKRIVELANQYDTMILEDSPYREVRYAGERQPTMRSFDTEGRVIHLGSFSKILAPGLRTGWAAADEAVIQRLGLLKVAADTQCSTLNMTAVSLFLDKCDVEKQIALICETYRHKKNLTIDVIRNSFPADVTYTDPEGGLFTWLTFPEGFDTAKFMREEALPKAKVAYVPGATFFPTVERPNYARVSLSAQSDDGIRNGLGALGQLVSSVLSPVA
tara:strand:- start:9327 stop:10523 length:1197 start_codon:yes stop_codon:yes gene_type:complete